MHYAIVLGVSVRLLPHISAEALMFGVLQLQKSLYRQINEEEKYNKKFISLY